MSLKPNGVIESLTTEEISRRLAQFDLATSTLIRMPPPSYDPIFTPLFASAGFTGVIAGGVTTGQVLSAITTTALSIGLQAALAPSPPKPENGKIPLKQSVPFRQWVVGRTRVGGAFMLWEASGSYLCSVQALAGHNCRGINKRWLHDDEVHTFSGKPDPYDNLEVIGIPGGRYGNGQVHIDYRLGGDDPTPYDFIVDKFADDDVPIWTNHHKGVGQTSLALLAKDSSVTKQSERFPYGPPQQSAELDGAFCWDPRDEDQDPDHPNTWLWTQNSALIILWWMCFSEFGFREDYRKVVLPVIDLWIEEADICDEDVPLSTEGQTQKRYQCNGFDTTENPPKVGLKAMLATCDGHLARRGDGVYVLTVGKFRESRCETITDADIIAHQVQYGVLFEDEINRLVPKFTYPSIDYATSDTDFFEDSDAQLVSGRVLSQDGDYQFCTQWQQARRLGIRDWRRIQQKVQGSIDVRLSGLNAIYSRWVRLDTPVRLPRLNNKVIENRHSVIAITRGGFTMDFVKHPDNIDDWNPETDEGQQPPIPPKPNTVNLVAPVIQSVVPRKEGGVTKLKVTLTDPDNDALSVTVEYRLKDDGTGAAGDWEDHFVKEIKPSGGTVIVNVSGVPANTILEVQAYWSNSRGQNSETSSPVEEVDTTL